MLGGVRIDVKDGALRGPDGTLAGSAISMIDAVRNAVSMMQVDLETAVMMASATPAAFLGLSQSCGGLSAGMRADIVHLSDDLEVRGTWISGAFETS
jgi:N-acetylglucosamine-6-phosphate deacetylase